MLVQRGRHAVEEAKAQIVLRDGVVIDGAVVASACPLRGKTWRQPDRFADFPRRHPAIGHAHDLVVQKTVHVPLRLQQGHGMIIAPGRPVVRGKHDLHVVAEHVERLLQIFRPEQAVPHFGAAQGVEIVKRMCGVFSRAECFVFWQIEHEFGGRLGFRRHEHLQVDSVDGDRFSGLGRMIRRERETDRAR